MVIKCRDCGTEFSVDEKEQKWFESKGLQMPKRCKACRDKRKQNNKKQERK
jgi:DNA replicative helicase MCM subunit Mcm2 (Cdc46/Mcm family)